MSSQIEIDTLNSQPDENPKNIEDLNKTEINPSENNPQNIKENHILHILMLKRIKSVPDLPENMKLPEARVWAKITRT